jgi:hypothetical protein
MNASAFTRMIASASARRRWSIASRALAAGVGGYALTSLFTLALPLALAFLGVNQAQALLAATIASFLLYAAIIMAVFHARNAARAWAWLIAIALPLGLVVWLLLPGTRT